MMMSSAVKIVRGWMRDFDGQIQDKLRQVEQKHDRRASCHDCRSAACCYEKIQGQLFEALPIAHRLRAERRDTPELRAKLREAGQAMKAAEPAAWLDTRTPCVFLDGSRCSIYKDRPSQCRAYYVFTPAELCEAPSRQEIAHLNTTTAHLAAAEFGREFQKKMGLPNTPTRIAHDSLPLVVLYALEALEAPIPMISIKSQKWPKTGDITPPAAVTKSSQSKIDKSSQSRLS